MANEKKNIPDAGKVEEPHPKQGKGRSCHSQFLGAWSACPGCSEGPKRQGGSCAV